MADEVEKERRYIQKRSTGKEIGKACSSIKKQFGRLVLCACARARTGVRPSTCVRLYLSVRAPNLRSRETENEKV